ncbi:transmembrane E3 ubiquitin-protein ligase 1 [Trichomonascus vanleenenianus]|uniref:ubiquitin-protein ligase TUL1 n=1 Tax=Trichomonascus vanleenenianus TaxID=2268995 RepID=UPI003EC9E805
MFFTPTGAPPRPISLAERRELKSYLKRQRHEIAVVHNSTWNEGYGNLTGLVKYPADPDPEWSILAPPVKEAAEAVWGMEAPHDEDLNYFYNISGSIRGNWEQLDANLVPVNMTTKLGSPRHNNATANATAAATLKDALDNDRPMPIAPVGYREMNMIEILSEQKPGNVSGMNSGHLEMTLRQRAMDDEGWWNVSIVETVISVGDHDDMESHLLELKGLYMRDTGNIVMATTSYKFSGENALPQLLLTGEDFEEAKRLIVADLKKGMGKSAESGNDEWDSYANLNYAYNQYEQAVVDSHKCEYIMYGHIHSTGLSRDELRSIEDELREPLGRPHVKVPDLKMDAVFYSPDCAIAFGTEAPLTGEKTERYFNRVRKTITVCIVLLLTQTVVTALQMRDTNTVSTISRVSFYTVGLMAVLDGAICLSALVSSFIETVALPFLAVAFIAFALTSIFEIKYMMLIYRSQMYESEADARARQVSDGSGPRFVARPDGTISNENELPTTEPVAAPQSPRVPDDEQHIMSMIYTRFYFCLLGFLFLSLAATSWPVVFRRVFEYAISIVLYSMWVPQIVRNVLRGSRKSFLWIFVIVMTVIRLLPTLYLCLDERNVLHHHYDPMLAIIIVSWQWVQLCILLAQSVFGPRFFLPRGCLPALYDYHPIITEDDLESGLNYTSIAESNDASSVTKLATTNYSDDSNGSVTSEDGLLASAKHPQFDCAICMTPVELLIVPKGSTHIALSPANLLARRRYMVTPCRHVFHTECMERWMRNRLQCPVCRNPLPPI